MDIVSVVSAERTFTVRLTESEMRVLWHSLNLAEDEFLEAYAKASAALDDEDFAQVSESEFVSKREKMWNHIDEILRS